MHWNHRVVQTTDRDGGPIFGLYEIFYDDDGRPGARTENPLDLGGFERVDDLRKELKLMLAGAVLPVLTDGDFSVDQAV